MNLSKQERILLQEAMTVQRITGLPIGWSIFVNAREKLNKSNMTRSLKIRGL